MNGPDGLTDMPAQTKQLLFAESDAFEDFKALWADCLDYALGYADLKWDAGKFAHQLALSLDQHLRSTVALLCEKPCNNRALGTALMGIELALKSYLADHHGMTERQFKSKKFGHGLANLVGKIMAFDPASEFHNLQGRVENLPGIEERYEGTARSPRELWQVYKLAQFAGAAYIRSATDRNVRTLLATRF